ncbi:DUF4232 domain-containing protein [Streptomyces litchfieldiae]|uniref:DUF4232 domain-containing protein n=1 Tax=Streptomyces litchfieldiae TaxID=3075543 RepID=A0ABU2MND3_9ACTN|nr:DUF4232 domain-containing protein [Streptomyces sp. DSM 44938]MDT0343132.1 DUF4232 domain-containing protein [Streptomyces sp. DSM 44938]
MTSFSFRRRTSTAVAAAALAALSLTACQDDEPARGAQDSASQAPDATQDEGQETSTAGGAGDEPTDADTEDTDTEDTGAEDTGAEDTETEDTDTGQQGTTEGGAGTTEEDAVPCDGSDTDLTVTAVERPINHLLLTVTNTGSETCFAWYGPYLRFGDAHSPAPWITESAPQAVTAIAPGESAYAAVVLSGDEAEGYTATSLGVQFSGADQSAVGDMEDVPLPGGEAYVDADLSVTYWLPAPDDALVW